jgi:hypothetical protein
MVASLAAVHGCGSVSIHMSRSKRVAGIVPSLWIWPLPSLTELLANCFLFRLLLGRICPPCFPPLEPKARQAGGSPSERCEKRCLLANSLLLEPSWAAGQYRDKQTIGYVSVHNGTDTNLRCG